MSTILLVLGIHMLALASPGPDLVLVLRASAHGLLARSISCCLGIAAGISTHLFFCYIGLSFALSQSGLGYSLIVIVACLWLLRMGLESLRSQGADFSGSHLTNTAQAGFDGGRASRSYWLAFRDGYITNLLNPKALVYFVSVISPLVNPQDEGALFMQLAITLVLASFSWFAFVALAMDRLGLQAWFLRHGRIIDRFFGVLLILLAVFLLASELSVMAG